MNFTRGGNQHDKLQIGKHKEFSTEEMEDIIFLASSIDSSSLFTCSNNFFS